MPQAGFDPPYARSNDLLNEKIDDLIHQATTAGEKYLWCSGKKGPFPSHDHDLYTENSYSGHDPNNCWVKVRHSEKCSGRGHFAKNCFDCLDITFKLENSFSIFVLVLIKLVALGTREGGLNLQYVIYSPFSMHSRGSFGLDSQMSRLRQVTRQVLVYNILL